MNPGSFSMSVLLHRDGDAWVAQCLEFDVAVQGATVEEVKNRFLRTLSAQIQDDLLDGREPLSNLSQAPQTYFNRLGAANLSGPELPIFVPAPVKKAKKTLVPARSYRAQFLETAANAG